MMTPDQLAKLLKLAAANDQRTVGEADVLAWGLAAEHADWHPAAAQRVVVEHYASGAERRRIDPADITDRLRAIRRRAAETFELPRIPDDLAEPYPAWLRRQRDAHVTAAVERWASTGEEPSDRPPALPAADPAGQARVAQLVEGAFAIPAEPKHPADRADPAGAPRRSALDSACDFCGAKPQHPCTRSGVSGPVRRASPHPTRGREDQAA